MTNSTSDVVQYSPDAHFTKRGRSFPVVKQVNVRLRLLVERTEIASIDTSTAVMNEPVTSFAYASQPHAEESRVSTHATSTARPIKEDKRMNVMACDIGLTDRLHCSSPLKNMTDKASNVR